MRRWNIMWIVSECGCPIYRFTKKLVCARTAEPCRVPTSESRHCISPRRVVRGRCTGLSRYAE